jgi:CRISPR/Cas system CMR-associated protein Cmr5 small subunit
MKFLRNIRGAITIPTLVGAAGLITFLLTPVVAFYTSKLQTTQAVATVDSKVESLDTREAAHFGEVLRSLDRIEAKLGTRPERASIPNEQTTNH